MAAAIVGPDLYDFVVEVLTIGDYVIQSGVFMLIIERKTWADLAASFMDERIFDNHKKMVRAAAEMVVLVGFMYLIEGEAPHPDKSDKKIDGMRIGAMTAKLDHFVMRDGAVVEYVSGGDHTAKRLLELGKHMASLEQPADPTIIDICPIVMAKQEASPHDTAISMWRCVPGVGHKTAINITANGSFFQYGDAKFADEKVSPRISAEIQTIVGGGRPATAISILSKIKGVSPAIAKLILEKYNIAQLNDVVGISNICRENGRRIGAALAIKIVSQLSYGCTTKLAERVDANLAQI